MKKICEKCGQEVPENQVVEFPVYLKGGQTLEPQLFEHKNCGGEVTEKQEKN